MTRVRDWQRLRPGIPVVDEPEPSSDGILGGGYAPNAMEEMEEMRLQRARSRAMSDDELEQIENADLAKLTRMQTRMAIMDAIQGGGRGKRGDDLAPLLQQLMQSNQETQRFVTQAITELQRGQREDAVSKMQRTIDGLEARLTELVSRPATMPPPQDATSALRNVAAELAAVKDFRHTLDEVLEAPGQAQAMISRDQALQQLKLQHEMKLAQLELDDKIADHQAARTQAERDYDLKRRRLDNAFGTAQQILPAVAAAFLGDKAKDVFGALGGASAPPAPSSNGHAAHIAPPPLDPPPTSPGMPGMQEWQCPSCNALNESAPTTIYATCARCGQEVEPFPQDDAPPHEHTVIDLPPLSDGA